MRPAFFVFVAGFVLLTAMTAAPQGKALFYETFEEYDFRAEGFLPAGIERSRISGRLFGTEMEIEAPADNGDTIPLAQFVPDPSGQSLVVLQLRDEGTEVSDDSFGADGGVSLLESILLDQGDYEGTAVVSWTAIAYQTNEPGGAMFPETDSRIDAGPEGLNLIGFGGVFRDFDTGEPYEDLSGQLTLNVEGSPDIDTLGVGYEAGVPIHFVLLFDLENSHYDIYINGVLTRTDVPFFDIQGEVGKTLRELELISSARGVGTFAYDNLFQIDPDKPYQPVPFRSPLIAQDAAIIPLFLEEFDDDPLGDYQSNSVGNAIPGSRANLNVEVVPDDSLQTLARGLLREQQTASFTFAPNNDESESLRFSFKVFPDEQDEFLFSAGDTVLLNLRSGSPLAIQTNEDSELESTEIDILAGVPHWFVVTVNPLENTYQVEMYRAASLSNPQTAYFSVTGVWNAEETITSVSWQSLAGDIGIDNLLGVVLNEHTEAAEANIYHAELAEDFESDSPGAHTDFQGEVVADPSGWSFNSLQVSTEQGITLLENAALDGSVRISWSAVPTQPNMPVGEILLQLEDSARGALEIPLQSTQEASLAADLVGLRHEFVLSLDLKSGYSVFHSRTPLSRGSITQDLELLNARLTGVRLTVSNGGTAYLDDLLIVHHPQGALFAVQDYEQAVVPAGKQLLFEENFENNPARSSQQVNEADARRSGLPIPTNSQGFSDFAETEIPGTTLIVGAPSADAAYVIDPDGNSLYSLYVGDEYAPQTFAGFEEALPFAPISTLRTVPYSFVVPTLAVTPSERYVQIRWSAAALQTDQIGLALFLETQNATIFNAHVPAPAGTPIVAFGPDGFIWADTDGNGELEATSFSYQTTTIDEALSSEMREFNQFILQIDRDNQSCELFINGHLAVSAPVAADTNHVNFLESFGWFSTLVNTGNEQELQQASTGGGSFIIDDIRVLTQDVPTGVSDFVLY
ncbi:MAG: hypothetical protein ACOX5R_13515 [bacterium]|jgi:hypothetical protein